MSSLNYMEKLLDGGEVQWEIMEPRMNTGKHRLKSIRACLCLSVIKKVLELKS